MFRILFYIAIFIVTSTYGGVWLWKYNPYLENLVDKYIPLEKIEVVESRYSPESILKSILKSQPMTGEEPLEVEYVPYTLLEVKYSQESQTGEGNILWSLQDGEIVLDMKTWEKTHGFKDFIAADTSKEEFKIINLLARNGGQLDRSKLLQTLRMEEEFLDHLLNESRKKKLIAQTGNGYRLHFENPRIYITPETEIDGSIVTSLASKKIALIPKQFSSYQIKKIAEAAFGTDFAIRNQKNIFLPVYKVVIQKNDGALQTTYWNSWNGKQIFL